MSALLTFMKKWFPLFVSLLVVTIVHPAAAIAPLLLANPLQGTDSRDSFSHGNTYPAIALPFPMNTWAPYTEPAQDSFFYQYRHDHIYGIRQTHEPSVWIRDHATFSLMPFSGQLVVKEKDRASTFRHEGEIAQPSYYKVRLDTWKATAEVTPTERAARFRFTFEPSTNAGIVLDVFESDKDASVEIIPSENKIIGVARNNSGAVPANYGNYFVIVFDRPFTTSGVWSDQAVETGGTNMAGRHVGAFVEFGAGQDRVVECKVASSFISPEQAERNLEQEIGGADFNAIRQRAEQAWNAALNRVQITGGSEEQQRTFYSALYRSILFPHRVYEWDGEHHPIYSSPYDGKIHSGVMYTDTGYWDTFRAAHPLYNLLYPEISAEILPSMLNAYRESGWLPAWSSPGQRQAMIGNHAFSVLADAWVKGITNFDLSVAVNATIHDAHHGGIFGMGRGEANDYDTLGYIPYPKTGDATSKTLDYAYDDFCAATLAQAAGRPADAQAFLKSAMNYTNVFDPGSGLMRGRKADGSWCEPNDPTEWGGPFIEGNSWQWSWSVMHDVPGLIKLMGGDRNFGSKLDALFHQEPAVQVGTYHHLIHEMNEMVAQNLGQYDGGNEIVQHVIYLYDYAGQPWKTQGRIRQVMNQLYQSTPDGLPGDEDNGQMSAWYVFSALGFYPVCPGSDAYLIGSPLFDQATINLSNGRKFVITAHDNGPQRPYISAATLNGQSLDKVFLRHSQITAGGEVRLEMNSGPDYHWASSPGSRPPALMPALQP